VHSNPTFKSISDFKNSFKLDSIEFFDISSTDSFSMNGIEEDIFIKNISLHSISRFNSISLLEIGPMFSSIFISEISRIYNMNNWIAQSPSILRLGYLNDLESLGDFNDISDLTRLELGYNPLLSDIETISQIDTFIGWRGLVIENNPLLEICNYRAICNKISNEYISSHVYIRDNADDCRSEMIVLDQCNISNTKEFQIENVNIYPNPLINGILNVEIPNENKIDFKIYDYVGRQRMSGILAPQLDLSHLPSGYYNLILYNYDCGIHSSSGFVKY